MLWDPLTTDTVEEKNVFITVVCHHCPATSCLMCCNPVYPERECWGRGDAAPQTSHCFPSGHAPTSRQQLWGTLLPALWLSCFLLLSESPFRSALRTKAGSSHIPLYSKIWSALINLMYSEELICLFLQLTGGNTSVEHPVPSVHVQGLGEGDVERFIFFPTNW